MLGGHFAIQKVWRTAATRAGRFVAWLRQGISRLQGAQRLERPVAVLLAAWVLTMIALPIVRWTLGDGALRQGIIVAVLLQVFVVVVILWRAWGVPRTLAVAGVVVSLAWAAEALGSKTGVPFGAYSYTDALQPQLASVPLLIPLAWLMMVPPAWAIASLIIADRPGSRSALKRTPPAGLPRRLAFVAASALALTAWDLFLDPQMVAWGFWTWEHESVAHGSYFGIPWVNFVGWLLVAALITAVVDSLFLGRPGSDGGAPRHRGLPVLPLVLVYAITWILEFIGQFFFWGLPGPALVGFLGMGAVLLWALINATGSFRSRESERSGNNAERPQPPAPEVQPASSKR